MLDTVDINTEPDVLAGLVLPPAQAGTNHYGRGVGGLRMDGLDPAPQLPT
jgi:hypothetical protein